eukprot:9942456-Alexandrium_andersonii.AAC.1
MLLLEGLDGLELRVGGTGRPLPLHLSLLLLALLAQGRARRGKGGLSAPGSLGTPTRAPATGAAATGAALA